MKNKAFDAQRHSFTAGDQILPDANIWVYLFGPASAKVGSAVGAYSSVLNNVLNAKSRLFLDALVMSEFINRYARLEYERLDPPDRVTRKRVFPNFKLFRDSPAFVPVAKDIAQQASVIISLCQSVDHHFAQWNVATLLADYATGGFDFNDQLLVETCRKYSLALLTNDTDFTEGGITVFTAHWRLLAACPP
jgi:predicted nucleic acid-binding protein